ncbi:hypothetical protein ACFW9F_06180, partial [Streptomyces sp. NPDC059506]
GGRGGPAGRARGGRAAAGGARRPVDSVIDIDLPMIMGVMLFSSALILLCNIVVDAAYALIDPRVRLDAGSSA